MDADATEALLKLASKTVDDQLGREQKYPELIDFFNTDYSATYVAPADPRQQILRRKRAISLPDTLFEQYNCTPFRTHFEPGAVYSQKCDLFNEQGQGPSS